MENEVILKLTGINKNFPGVKALQDVQLELRKGEVLAVVGENGAGKSTLMNVILGLYIPDSGTVVYKGEEVRFHSPSQALESGISMIHQEIMMVPQMDVSQNLWLGREEKFIKNGFINHKACYKATQDIFDRLGLHIDPHTQLSEMSIAEMQMVEVARAVSYSANVIIMDEPTSALAKVEVDALYRIIRELKASGVAIIFISHKLEEIFEISDRVSVYRDGHYIETRSSKDITMDELIQMVVGRNVDNLFPKEPAEIGETVLEVKNLSRTGVFKDVSFTLKTGEILGFSGLVGAGRTEIMSALFGIDKADSGEVWIKGKKARIRSPKDAVKYGLGMVTEDRLRQGAIHVLSVMANATVAYFYRFCNKLGFYRPKTERLLFEPISKKMQIKCSSPGQLISQLSGGNQQKVIIGRWILMDSDILILDEPTRGIDVGSKAEIHHIISQMAQEGKAVIMVSSELPEILGMSDRIIVVRNGRIVYETSREDATQEILISHAFGVAT